MAQNTPTTSATAPGIPTPQPRVIRRCMAGAVLVSFMAYGLLACALLMMPFVLLMFI